MIDLNALTPLEMAIYLTSQRAGYAEGYDDGVDVGYLKRGREDYYDH